MYNIKVDAHTHTIYTKHAFSTIKENACAAAKNGIDAIGWTDHFGLWIPSFENTRKYEPENHIKPSNLPDKIDGIKIFKGVELDIINIDGDLAGSDLNIDGYLSYSNFLDYLLNSKDIAIASLHYFPNFKSYTKKEYTKMYINSLSKKGVTILGHPSRAGVEFDIIEVVKFAKEYNKIIEINEETLKTRPQMMPICKKIAEACAKIGTLICVNSDAHFCDNIGNVSISLNMLKEIEFPYELIANRSLDAFEDAVLKSKIAYE